MLPSLPDRVLECLTRLEYGSLGCGDLHGLLGAGVAAGAGSPLFDLKGTEADQLHLLAGLQSSLDRGDERSQSSVAVLFGKAAGLSHGGDQFSLIHCMFSSYSCIFRWYSAIIQDIRQNSNTRNR